MYPNPVCAPGPDDVTPYRQIPRQSEMLRLLARGRVDTSPLRLVTVERDPNRKGQPNVLL